MNPQKSQSAFREHTATGMVVSKQHSHEVRAASELSAETLQCHDATSPIYSQTCYTPREKRTSQIISAEPPYRVTEATSEHTAVKWGLTQSLSFSKEICSTTLRPRPWWLLSISPLWSEEHPQSCKRTNPKAEGKSRSLTLLIKSKTLFSATIMFPLNM